MPDIRNAIEQKWVYVMAVIVTAIQFVVLLAILPPHLSSARSHDDNGCVVFASWGTHSFGQPSIPLLVLLIGTVLFLALVAVFPGLNVADILLARYFRSHRTLPPASFEPGFWYIALFLFVLPLAFELTCFIDWMLNRSHAFTICY